MSNVGFPFYFSAPPPLKNRYGWGMKRAWRAANSDYFSALERGGAEMGPLWRRFLGARIKPRKEVPFFPRTISSYWSDPFLLHQHPSCDFWIALFQYLVPSISRHIGRIHSSCQHLAPDVWLPSSSPSSFQNGPSGTGCDCVPPRPPTRYEEPHVTRLKCIYFIFPTLSKSSVPCKATLSESMDFKKPTHTIPLPQPAPPSLF